MKWNITPVTLTSEKDKARIVSTLFKVKLLVLVKQTAGLLKQNFPNAFFLRKFLNNFYFKLLLVVGSEKLGKRLRIRRRQFRVFYKLCIMKKNTNFQEKCWSPPSVMLPYDFVKTGLHQGYLPRNVPTYFGNFICLVSQLIVGFTWLCMSMCNYCIEKTAKIS